MTVNKDLRYTELDQRPAKVLKNLAGAGEHQITSYSMSSGRSLLTTFRQQKLYGSKTKSRSYNPNSQAVHCLKDGVKNSTLKECSAHCHKLNLHFTRQSITCP